MMSFDTLSYAKKLREAGVPEQQAEVHAQAVQTLLEERLASKQDIELVRREMKEMEARLGQEIGGVRHEIELVRREIKELEARMVQKVELTNKDVLMKLGAIVVACTGVLAALLGVVIALIQLQ